MMDICEYAYLMDTIDDLNKINTMMAKEKDDYKLSKLEDKRFSLRLKYFNIVRMNKDAKIIDYDLFNRTKS